MTAMGLIVFDHCYGGSMMAKYVLSWLIWGMMMVEYCERLIIVVNGNGS